MPSIWPITFAYLLVQKKCSKEAYTLNITRIIQLHSFHQSSQSQIHLSDLIIILNFSTGPVGSSMSSLFQKHVTTRIDWFPAYIRIRKMDRHTCRPTLQGDFLSTYLFMTEASNTTEVCTIEFNEDSISESIYTRSMHRNGFCFHTAQES